jgi:hypothetical protein
VRQYNRHGREESEQIKVNRERARHLRDLDLQVLTRGVLPIQLPSKGQGQHNPSAYRIYHGVSAPWPDKGSICCLATMDLV